MKPGIFISYSNLDKRKVDLLVREINALSRYIPIVIASDREVGKPLADKVAERLIKAEIVIPILTINSLFNQWVNQEIGFAIALNKKVIPIIDRTQIDSLKGFIHKQIDLPYSFSSAKGTLSENKEFVKSVRSLINDLNNPNEPEKLQKNNLENSIENLENIIITRENLERKEKYLDSLEGMNDARTEVKNIMFWAEKNISNLNLKNISINFNIVEYPPKLEAQKDEFKFIISWKQQHTNSNVGAYLLLQKLRLNSRDEFFQTEKQIYTYDVGTDKIPFWNNQKDKVEKNSEQIIIDSLDWLISEYTKKYSGYH